MLLLLVYFSLVSGDDLDNMVNLTRATGNRFLIDLNLQLRFGKQWDPSNAVALMQYMAHMNYGDNIDFELGNGKKRASVLIPCYARLRS